MIWNKTFVLVASFSLGLIYPVQGEDKMDTGTIVISPSSKNAQWSPKRKVFPLESVSLSVQVEQYGMVGDMVYELQGTPTPILNAEGTLWTQAQGGSGSENSFAFEMLNTGQTEGKQVVKLNAKWKLKSESTGGGEGKEEGGPDVINGEGKGEAEVGFPNFVWTFEKRLEYADGVSEIVYSVTTTDQGYPKLDLKDYQVKGESGWKLTQTPAGGTIKGTVKSTQSNKGTLQISYKDKTIGKNEEEIAFNEFDISISSSGNDENLAEDRMPGGKGMAASPHEMEPGSIIITAESSSKVISGMRSKLSLTGKGTSMTQGSYVLNSSNAAEIALYETPEGGNPIPLPKTFSATELGNKTFYVGTSKSENNSATSTLTLTYRLPLKAGAAIHKLEDKVKVSAVQVEIIVGKDGQSGEADDGVIVKKMDNVRYKLSPRLPDSPVILKNKIKWYWRILKMNGSYGEWTKYQNGNGHTFTAHPKSAGIYEIKAVINEKEFFYIRKSDARHADSSQGEVQEIHKKGAHDCLGVVDEEWQLRLRETAKNNLGSTRWMRDTGLSLTLAAHYKYGDDKCNAFVYEQDFSAGTPVPVRYVYGIPRWPASAFDWWNDNTGRVDSAGRVMISEPIENWQRLPDDTNPQPGYVVSRAKLSDQPPRYHSHVGILDYDGSWISAGVLKINKYYHPSSTYLDTNDNVVKSYQPQSIRKYLP